MFPHEKGPHRANHIRFAPTSALKVTTKQGQETDLRSQVLDIRAKYLGLQQRSVPIARDISAYALISEVSAPV